MLLIGIAIGSFAGRQLSTPATSQSPLPRYLFLFSGSRSAAMPRAEIMAIGRDFRAWTDSLDRHGLIAADGQLFRGTVSVIPAANPSLDSTSLGALGAMEGMLLVHVPDDSLAVALARSCPFLRYGGTIVVRKMVGPAPGRGNPKAAVGRNLAVVAALRAR